MDTNRFDDESASFLGKNAAGHLEIEGHDVASLADAMGTPTWVVSANRVRANYRRLQEAFTHVYPRTAVAYASKANPEPAIIRLIALEGGRVDVVSAGQIGCALAAGLEPERLIFNGNNKTERELTWALDHGLGVINVESVDEMELLASLQPLNARPMAVCLRLAVDDTRFAKDDPQFAHLWSGGKFAMDLEDVLVAADIALEHPALKLVGLHEHIGWPVYGVPYSVELDLNRHAASVEHLIESAAGLQGTRGVSLDTLNLGGGFRISRPEGFGPGGITEGPSTEDYASVVGGRFRELVNEHGLGEPELILEAGGYVVADAAILLARVGMQKTRRRAEDADRRWVFLEETSGYHFVRRLMFDFRHHVVAATKLNEAADQLISIAGPTCAADDVAMDVYMPRLQRGDLVALLDQGAYCEAIATDFCAIPIPQVVLVDHARADVIRERETVDKMLDRFSVPSWLDTSSVPRGPKVSAGERAGSANF